MTDVTDDDLDDDLEDAPELFDRTPRFVLLQVMHESECDGAFQEDDWNDALTEQQMLEMLAAKLGYDLIKKDA